MNKDNAISKVNSIGKAGSIISKISMICLTVGTVIAIICGIIFLTVPKEDFTMKLDDNATITLNTGSKTLSSLFGINPERSASEIAQGSMSINDKEYSFVDTDYDANSKIVTYTLKSDNTAITVRRFALVAWIAVAYCVLNYVLLFFIKKLCDALKQCQTPFEESIITGIQRIAWALIPWAVLGGCFESILSTAFTGNIQIGIGLNLTMVLVILLLFGLAHIFKYGAVLQTESDETL
jgi:hypothetical protein